MRRKELGRVGGWMAAALWLVFAGCSGDGGGPKPGGTAGNPLSLPLTQGTRWAYTVTETSEGDSDTFDRIDEVVGSRTFEGQAYTVLRSIVSEVGGASPDSSESYLRQVGQDLFTFQDFDTAGVGDEEWLVDLFLSLRETMPWRLAAFTSVSGDAWTPIDYEKVWQTEGGTVTISVDVRVSNDGRTDLTVPAGSYADVYIGTVTQDFTFLQNTPPLPPLQQRQLFTQKIYMKDGIGVIKEDTTLRFQVTGSPDEQVLIVGELESFEPAP